MKVLMINIVCGIRSTGRICTDIAKELIKNGHECRIAYGREVVPEKYRKYAIRIGNDYNIKLHGLTTRLLDRHGFGSYLATKRFIKWVEQYNPDVIHLHNIHGYFINIRVLFTYLAKANKPVIWTLHDCWPFTGHCAYFDYVGCEKWKTQCFACPNKKDYPQSLLLDQSSKNYREKKNIFTSIKNMTFVTPSHWLAGLVKQSFLKDYPVQVIHNGIDLTVFKPTPSDFRKRYNLDDKQMILAVASTWDKRKGYNDLLKLADLLNEDQRLVLVGVSNKQLAELPEKVIGIPRTNSTKELAEIYTAADVFVNPTYEDNYPTVNLEAQACGTPVITYETGGSPESIHRVSGIILNDKSVNQLYSAVSRAPEKGKHGLSQYASEFGNNRSTIKYNDLYYQHSRNVE